MKIGDKIKSFQVKNIVDSVAFTYDSKGNKTKYITQFMLLKSDNGQERVLEIGKTNLNDCKMLKTFFGSKSKFITWEQLNKA
jgi:UV DNA damage repair endonuclease